MLRAGPRPGGPRGSPGEGPALLPSRAGRADVAVLLALTAVGLALRLVFLGHLPLWRDEAFTALVARRSWGEMLAALRQDSAPPLGYLLAHLAAAIDPSALSLRLVSALSGTVAVPIAATLGRRAGGRAGALGAAALVAVAPEGVLLGRDARMYALATTLSLACALTLWRALERPDPRRLGTHALVVALALATHYLVAVALVAQFVAAAALRPGRRALGRASIATVGGTACLVPWLAVAAPQLGHAEGPFWLPAATWTAARTAILTLLRGATNGDDRVVAHPLELVALGVWFVATVGVVLALREKRRGPLLYLTGAGLLGLTILHLAAIERPILDARYDAVVWMPLVVAFGVGLARLRPTLLPAAALVGMLAATATTLTLVHRTDWRPIVSWLDGRLGPSDTVLMDSPDYLVLLEYGGERIASHTHLLRRDPAPWYWGTAAYPPGAVVHRVPATSGTIYVFPADFGADLALPPGFRWRGRWCSGRICIDAYRR